MSPRNAALEPDAEECRRRDRLHPGVHGKVSDEGPYADVWKRGDELLEPLTPSAHDDEVVRAGPEPTGKGVSDAGRVAIQRALPGLTKIGLQRLRSLEDNRHADEGDDGEVHSDRHHWEGGPWIVQHLQDGPLHRRGPSCPAFRFPESLREGGNQLAEPAGRARG